MKKILLISTFFVSIALNGQVSNNNSYYDSLILKQNTGLKPGDLSEMRITAQSTDEQNGVTHVYFNQYYKSIPIYNAAMSLHYDRYGIVITMNHSFVRNIASHTESAIPSIDVKSAIVYAINTKLKDIKIINTERELKLISESEETYLFQCDNYSQNEIKAYLTWLPLDGKLVLAWNVNWLTKDEQNWWNIRVDAKNGKVLGENNWITHCNPSNLGHSLEEKSSALELVAPGDGEGTGEGSSSAEYRVLPRPVESPFHGIMALLKDPSDSLSSPFSWHDDNGVKGHEYTITRGNNVYACEDKDNNNSPGYSPDGGSLLKFDYPFDITKNHTLYLDAAITNLFYWNNLMHDVWYHYGFDAAGGNFQVNNYGRGGAGNDGVMAEAQDGSGTNNANFATPPDGQNPRMQMYVWNISSTNFLLRVLQPASIARPYLAVLASFGPTLTKTPIIGNLILVDDGSANSSLGCQTLVNGNAISGQIALIDRGTCSFFEKVKFAQDKGAKAAIIINNVIGNSITMGSNGGTGVNIPAIMITKADGDNLKNTLKTQSIKVSLYDSSSANSKQYDSDFDNGIISHEYGHGISNRLTGGPANTNCLTNQEQMGEGWSDFFSLVMTHKLGDKGIDKRGIGTYAIDEPNDGNGIRNFPYSTSLTINPVTYNNIKTFSVPHGVGSVWCSMLWDMYWDLVDRYGYDPDIYKGKGGNNIAMKLVMDGLKMQPCNPGFEDGRNAILLADEVNNGGKNKDLIWKAFARRGLGFSAKQGSTNSRSDGTEGFDIPKLIPELSKTTLTETRNGDTLIYKIVIKNTNSKTSKLLTFRDTIKSGLQFIKAEGCFNGSFFNQVYSGTIDSLQAGDSLVCNIYTRVTISSFTNFVDKTDFENGGGNWKDSTLSGTVINWFASSKNKYQGAKSYFITNAASKSDKVLMKLFDLNSSNPHLIFYHLYNSETDWDGGVVEIYNNGNWEDLGSFMIENAYNKSISVNPESSISGRMAFTGNSNKFIRTVVDLSSFKGQKTRIRFRFVSDGAQGGEGWYIDDITLADNFVNVNNSATLSELDGGNVSSEANSLVLKGNVTTVFIPKAGNFKVSPNPFKNEITVESTSKNYEITLMDVLGKNVFDSGIVNDKTTIETSGFAAGTYFLRIKTNQGMEVVKLVK